MMPSAMRVISLRIKLINWRRFGQDQKEMWGHTLAHVLCLKLDVTLAKYFFLEKIRVTRR